MYNENGLRVQKSVNGVVTKYTLHGKNIVHMTTGSNELHFFYDAQNKPAIVVYNGTPYSYVKNLQGDIVAILDSDKNVVVKYVYDAWGKPISKTGSMASTLGTVQPFRYRGYVYDEETGLFYLRSRFYNCNACRFLNSDTLLGNGKLISYNQFAYCRNAHVNRFDPDGYFGIGVALGVAGGLIALLWPSRGLAPEDEADIPPTSVEEHWGRNQYNQLPDESELLSIVGGTHPDWEEQDESANKYHRFTHGVQGAEAVYNKKYMSRDGKFEVIICYDAEYVPTPYIVTDPINAGTYNYYDYRDGLSGAWGHLQYDVIPYYLGATLRMIRHLSLKG